MSRLFGSKSMAEQQKIKKRADFVHSLGRFYSCRLRNLVANHGDFLVS